MQTLTTEPDIDALLDEARFEEHGCETSRHTDNHATQCGRPALYLFTGYDETCGKWRRAYLCGPCMPHIVRVAPKGQWCCFHQSHTMTLIRTVRIGV